MSGQTVKAPERSVNPNDNASRITHSRVLARGHAPRAGPKIDIDTYLEAHHDTWYRWSLRSETLEDRDAIRAFWHRAKEFEQTVAFVLDPVAVEVYGGGAFAAVHYVADEPVRLLQERVNRESRAIPSGDETHILIRFSDFYVLEGENWLFVGGYRDGSCALFHGFGQLCGE